ncbi:iron-siderophore ABC transporter substrate-binding protein [Nocardioides speluncae]|uniref:iron-siderophore ABC transporter substrate-binding protein n=1 Tax=Nocardioides speluncae TaxID=2670337 RepID=UPI000D68E872|nr:iron-siderophore ABC transporter substrate-binding protein [Nocardioides speluncae]
MWRPRFLAAAGAAVVLTASLTSCSTGSTEAKEQPAPERGSKAEEGALPTTVKHVFGETTIEAEPKRVVTLGWSDQDFVLALGVVPVAVNKVIWGGNENGSTDWFDQELERIGGEAPVQYDGSTAAPVDDIAKLDPDLILAANSGVTKAEYAKLSKIAPVVAYPGAPWTTDWQDSLKLIGQALGRPKLAAEKLAKTQDVLAQAQQDHPELVGTTVLFAGISTADLSKIDYLTSHDTRMKVLEQVGLVNAPVVKKMAGDSTAFYESVSAERADTLASDVAILMPYEEPTEAEYIKQVEGDALISKIPAVTRGAWWTGGAPRTMLSLSAPSPLSLPWAMDNVIPEIAAAAKKSG